MLFAPKPYSGFDPWCQSNFVGGPHIEALLRSDHLGFAYGTALRFLEGTTTYANTDYLGNPQDWLPSAMHLSGSEMRNFGATDVEIAVRAPLRFSLFNEWGQSLSHGFSDRPRGEFWRESAADNAAVGQMLALEDHGLIGTVPWREIYGLGSSAVGMAIHLQMQRVDLLQCGLPVAIRYLCLPQGESDYPPMTRLSLGEVMYRCMNVIGMAMGGTSHDSRREILFHAVNEMQLFFLTVAARFLSRVGGTIYLESLRRVGWEAMLDHYEDAAAELRRYSPDEVREFEEAQHT